MAISYQVQLITTLLIIIPTRIAITTPLLPTVPARLLVVPTSVVITLTSLLVEFGVVFVTSTFKCAVCPFSARAHRSQDEDNYID